MSDKQKRSQEVLRSAEKAISKITDPSLRAKAVAKLEATRKQMAKGNVTTPRANRATDRDRGQDFDR